MASNSKEYQMLFTLNGQLNGGFTSSFSKASETVRNMQKELDALNQQQSQISAYEKQQAAIDKTQSKLQLLQKQYDNIQRELDETGGKSSDLQNKLLSKQAAIDKTSASLQQQTAKLNEMGSAMSEAGIDVNNLTGEQKRLASETDQLKKAQEDAAEQAQKMGDSTTDAINGMATAFVSSGILDAFKKLGDAYKDCLEVSGNFEQAMSQVAATMGTTSDQVQDLGDFAKQMGASTSFTAVQAADGLNVLAMAGLNANEQVEGLPTVLDLAAAGGMDMATAAGYVTTAVKGFSDSMDNAGYYADLMAKGATMANTNVQQLGEALATSGATAAGYSQSADSVTLSLLRLAEQGKTGAEAGTMLNRAMADLYTPTDDASIALGKLGVSAYDANGNAKDFNDVVAELQNSLSGMSEEEKNATLNTIFTTNGLNAFNKMCVSSTEKVNQFKEGLAEATGSTAQQAKTQLDNMNGAYTIMQSALEGVQISLGELWQGDMTNLYKIAGDLLTQLNQFIKDNPAVVKGITAGVAALGVLTAGLVAYKAVTGLATAATAIFGATLNGIPIMAVIGGIAAATAGIVTLVSALDNSVDPMDQMTYATQEQQAKLEDLQAQYDEACKKYGATSDEASKLKYQIDDLSDSIQKNGQTVQQMVDHADQVISEYNDLQDSFEKQKDSISENEAETFGLIAKLNDLASSTDNAAGRQEAMQAIIDELNNSVDGLGLSYDELSKNQNGAIDRVKELAKAQADQQMAEEKAQEYVEALKQQSQLEDEIASAKENLAIATDKQTEAQEKYNEAASSKFWIKDESDALKAANTQVEQTTNVLDDYQSQLDEVNQTIKETEQAWEEQQEAQEKASASAAQGAEDTLSYQEAVALAVEDVQQSMTDLAQSYQDAYESAQSSFDGMFGIFDEATMKSDDYKNATVANAQEALNSQLAYWQSYSDNIKQLKDMSASDLGVTQQQYNALMSQLQDGSEQSAGLAASITANLDAGNQEAVKKLAETAGTVAQTRDEIASDVAEWQTNFDSTMDSLVSKMDQTVDKLDMSEGASESARTTIASYAQTISDNRSSAVNAAQSVVDAVAQVFASSSNITVQDPDSAIGKKVKKIKGNASGTMNADDAYIAGENGPELILDKGGSEVFPTSETNRIISAVNSSDEGVQANSGSSSGGSTQQEFNISMPINISGSASSDTVSQLQSAGGSIIEQVRQAIEEITADQRRMAFT